MEVWMQLATIAGLFIATVALIYAFKVEAKNDLIRSNAEAKSDLIRSNAEMREFTTLIISGVNAQVIAIQQEMKDFHAEIKDFHGKLISLEERSKGLDK